MSIELKTGGINEFFNSAKETANEIDSGKKVSKKNIVWINTTDLVQILKPERTKIVTFLRGKKEVVFSDLEVEMGRTKASLNNDLNDADLELLIYLHCVGFFSKKHLLSIIELY